MENVRGSKRVGGRVDYVWIGDEEWTVKEVKGLLDKHGRACAVVFNPKKRLLKVNPLASGRQVAGGCFAAFRTLLERRHDFGQ